MFGYHEIFHVLVIAAAAAHFAAIALFALPAGLAPHDQLRAVAVTRPAERRRQPHPVATRIVGGAQAELTAACPRVARRAVDHLTPPSDLGLEPRVALELVGQLEPLARPARADDPHPRLPSA